jgi:hypothetical protein
MGYAKPRYLSSTGGDSRLEIVAIWQGSGQLNLTFLRISTYFLSTTRPNRVANINGQPQKHYMHYGPEKNIGLFFLVL